MDGDEPYVIVDVRTKEEYDEGHIPGAVLLPLDDIDAASAASVLPDKNVMLLVYCRSGRRSKLASEQLLALGYTDIREFGGILDWTYGTEK
jgi:rhodanese-related sulfurtransferase